MQSCHVISPIARWNRVLAALTFVSILGSTGSVSWASIQITPDTLPVWTLDSNSNPSEDDIKDATGFLGDLFLRYKSEVDSGNEEGTHDDFYSAAYFNEPDDPEDATISWDGPDAILDTVLYLIVKNGNHPPPVYIFDISGWDRISDIEITGFWPDKGAISNVAIWGDGTFPTPDDEPGGAPEPTALLVWSLLIISSGFVGARRRTTA